MPSLMTAGAMITAVIILAVFAQREVPSAGPFEVGQPVPSFVLPDAADGRPRTVAEFRGRKVILHVFASW